MKCDRCGKEIKDNNYQYKVSMPDINDEVETSVWCKECHDEFIDSFTSPTKAFEGVKPSYININKIKEQLKNWR